MPPQERYYWDLTGHLVIPDVLTSDEVAAANESLDYLVDQLANGTDEESVSAKAPSPCGSTMCRSSVVAPLFIVSVGRSYPGDRGINGRKRG